MIRCKPVEDGTNGFFVACFARRMVGGLDAQLEEEEKEVEQSTSPQRTAPKPKKRMRLTDIREAHRKAKASKSC
jgi:hypothetical protein